MGIDWRKPEGDAWDTYATTVKATSSFARQAAPTLFTWLEWCALLAILRYVGLKTGLWPFAALQWVLGLLLWGYFSSLLNSSDPQWLPRVELFARSIVVTMILSFLATAGMVAASFWVAGVFMRYPL